jgi:hypothetical protein
MCITQNGHFAAVRRLLDAGADAALRNGRGNTAQKLAQMFRKTEIDQLLTSAAAQSDHSAQTTSPMPEKKEQNNTSDAKKLSNVHVQSTSRIVTDKVSASPTQNQKSTVTKSADRDTDRPSSRVTIIRMDSNSDSDSEQHSPAHRRTDTSGHTRNYSASTSTHSGDDTHNTSHSQASTSGNSPGSRTETRTQNDSSDSHTSRTHASSDSRSGSARHVMAETDRQNNKTQNQTQDQDDTQTQKHAADFSCGCDLDADNEGANDKVMYVRSTRSMQAASRQDTHVRNEADVDMQKRTCDAGTECNDANLSANDDVGADHVDQDAAAEARALLNALRERAKMQVESRWSSRPGTAASRPGTARLGTSSSRPGTARLGSSSSRPGTARPGSSSSRPGSAANADSGVNSCIGTSMEYYLDGDGDAGPGMYGIEKPGSGYTGGIPGGISTGPFDQIIQSKFSWTCVHICIYGKEFGMHTYIHTYIHTHTGATERVDPHGKHTKRHIHTYIHTYTPHVSIYKSLEAHTHRYTNIHTYIHTQVLLHVSIYKSLAARTPIHSILTMTISMVIDMSMTVTH